MSEPKSYKLKRTYPRVEPDLAITGELVASVSDREEVEPKSSHWTEIRLFRLENDPRGTLAAAVVHRTVSSTEDRGLLAGKDVFRAVISNGGGISGSLEFVLTDSHLAWWDVGLHHCHVCRHPLIDLIRAALWEAGETKMIELNGTERLPGPGCL